MIGIAGYVAAALTLVWALVHAFVGGAETATPLLHSALPEVARGTGWLVWQFMTGLLLVMSAMLAWGTRARNAALLWAASAQAAMLALLGIALVPVIGMSYGLLPQGWLFLPVALLGVVAARGAAR